MTLHDCKSQSNFFGLGTQVDPLPSLANIGSGRAPKALKNKEQPLVTRNPCLRLDLLQRSGAAIGAPIPLVPWHCFLAFFAQNLSDRFSDFLRFIVASLASVGTDTVTTLFCDWEDSCMKSISSYLVIVAAFCLQFPGLCFSQSGASNPNTLTAPPPNDINQVCAGIFNMERRRACAWHVEGKPGQSWSAQDVAAAQLARRVADEIHLNCLQRNPHQRPICERRIESNHGVPPIEICSTSRVSSKIYCDTTAPALNKCRFLKPVSETAFATCANAALTVAQPLPPSSCVGFNKNYCKAYNAKVAACPNKKGLELQKCLGPD